MGLDPRRASATARTRAGPTAPASASATRTWSSPGHPATPRTTAAARALSHLAFHAGSAADVDRLWDAAPAHGWSRLYADRHPFAGGSDHRAAFLEDAERFKVELVADPGI
ncbi:hypothetical protein [Clavibacter tessellarius]|uniref:hypothetical protein n=1 Tax=Clavibacter tessellarius TaxID=31965 RepID=UPI0039BF95DB